VRDYYRHWPDVYNVQPCPDCFRVPQTILVPCLTCGDLVQTTTRRPFGPLCPPCLDARRYRECVVQIWQGRSRHTQHTLCLGAIANLGCARGALVDDPDFCPECLRVLPALTLKDGRQSRPSDFVARQYAHVVALAARYRVERRYR